MLWVKGVKHDETVNPKGESWVWARGAARMQDCKSEVDSADGTISWVAAAEASMKVQPQRRRSIMQMKRARQQWKARKPYLCHFRVSRQLGIWKPSGAHTVQSLV